MVNHVKTSAADTSETALEQTFSDLANARLRDLAPALLDYLVGFQLVKSTDDGSKVVGLFGFEIGDQFEYIPVFFKNGEIRGMDSVYSPDSDLFIPLTDDWVSQIVNRKQDKLGEPNKQSDSERGTKAPNYYRLRQIPTGAGTNLGGESGLLSKRGADESVGAAGLSETQAQWVLESMVKCAAAEERSNDASLDLPSALAHFPKIAAGFLADVRSNPKLAHYVQRFYSQLDLAIPEVVKVAASKDEDVVIVSEITSSDAKKLTDEQKELVIRGGTAVVDNRPELKKSKVYRTEVKQQLTSATAGGLYDVLMTDGSIEPFLIFKIASSDDMLAYELSSGKSAIIASKFLTTLKQYSAEEFRSKLDAEAIDVMNVKAGDAAVFVSQAGESSIPFVIESAFSGLDGAKVLKTEGRYYLPLSTGFCSAGRLEAWGPIDRANAVVTVWRHEAVADRIKDIVISEAGGGSIRYYNDRLAINSRKFKALVLNTRKNNGDAWPEWSRKTEDACLSKSDFGTADTIIQQMEKISHPLKIWNENGYLAIKDVNGNTETLGKVAALGHLIRKHGCDADDAEQMIKEATRHPQIYRVKYAAHLLDVADPQDEGESGPMSSYHPTQFKTHVIDKADSDDNRSFYQYNSPFAGNDDQQGDDGGDASPKKTMDAVQDAAQTGQKEVFDAAVLGSLVKAHNPTDMVEKFLPTIVSGMDRLGRIMFLLNWHAEDFKDRYGDKDLSEFADNLKSCFEGLGDLVIFMKKRTLSGDPEHYGLGLSSTIDG